jgi:sulfite exporter TauE/SafE
VDGYYAVMLAAGLASGVHCVAMCGGIVTAFDGRRVIPLRPAVDWGRRLAFNAGRISTYAATGAAASLFGSAAYASGALPAQSSLHFAVSLLLVLIGLHLAGSGRWLARVEAIGAPLWKRLQPLAARALPAATLPRMFAAGLVWGWLPCFMVYAALGAAVLAGNPARGALGMLAFGLGTLPFLLGAAWLAARLRAWRRAAAALILGFGVYGLAHAGAFGDAIRRGLLCFNGDLS